MERCPTCNSPSPECHPAVQFEGEVGICTDAFHLQATPSNRPEYIKMVLDARAKKRAAQIAEEGAAVQTVANLAACCG